MRHRKKGHKMGRAKGHRKRTLQAMSNALIDKKRIQTTVPKAKALRPFVEPLITRAKVDTTHNRRQVFRHLQDKRAVRELFDEVAVEVGNRTGGYTRIIKLGRRTGDGAERAMVELVDYGGDQPQTGSSSRGRTRRSGGSSGPSLQTGGPAGGESPAAGEDTQTASEGKPETAATQTTDQQESMGGVETDAVEAPVPEDQKEPVPERTEARDEAVASGEETAQTDDDADEETDENKS